MLISMLIQILAACAGVVGSLFFAIGVMRQSVHAMADLSGSYFDWNTHMVTALAAQKADYLFGGGIIVLSFATQLASYLFVADRIEVSARMATLVPWIILVGTIATFFLLRILSRGLAARFERQIKGLLEERNRAALVPKGSA